MLISIREFLPRISLRNDRKENCRESQKKDDFLLKYAWSALVLDCPVKEDTRHINGQIV